MFGLQPLEIILIAIVALFLFGPKKLPEIARSLGQSIREFRASTSQVTEEFRKATSLEPDPPAATHPPMPAPQAVPTSEPVAAIDTQPRIETTTATPAPVVATSEAVAPGAPQPRIETTETPTPATSTPAPVVAEPGTPRPSQEKTTP